jgi:hypothetical protein
MAAAGEMAEPSPNDVAPYTDQVRNIGQVNVGELVVLRPLPPAGMQLPPGIALGGDKILMVRGKEQDHDGQGPSLNVGIFWVPLQPRPRDFLRFAVFRRPAVGAAAAAGGKRRRKATRRQKKRRSTRRWFY